jgi:hypothetical protein
MGNGPKIRGFLGAILNGSGWVRAPGGGRRETPMREVTTYPESLLMAVLAYDTGFVAADAEQDFRRMRRQGRWSRLAAKLRLICAECTRLSSFADVIAGLGVTARHDLGLQAVELDTIVGSVGRVDEFDRGFRPGRTIDPRRWMAIDRALRNGEPLPPVLLYRVGEQHFVQDGHHRVSASRAVGRQSVDAYVTEVLAA